MIRALAVGAKGSNPWSPRKSEINFFLGLYVYDAVGSLVLSWSHVRQSGFIFFSCL